MSRWVIPNTDDASGADLAIIEASPMTRTVLVNISAATMTPEQVDRLRTILGLAAGVARGTTP